MAEQRGTVDYMWGGLDAAFRSRLEAFIAASGGSITMISGYRSNEHQADLVRQAQARHGADWRRWAAPPGGSNHNRGVAGDLRFTSDQAKQWAHQNARLFGLHFPMDHEPWHIEPIGLNDGKFEGMEPWRDAYTPWEQSLNPVDQRPDMMTELDRLLRGRQPTMDEVPTPVSMAEDQPRSEASFASENVATEGQDFSEVTDNAPAE